MSPKVLFLTHSPETPSARFRARQLAPHLEREGLECRAEPVRSFPVARWRQLARAADYDVVVLQKRLLPAFWTRVLRRNARRLVYDFDDAVYLSRTGAGVVRSAARTKRFAAIVRAADAVIPANEVLAAEAERHAGSKKIKVLPIAVDLSRWPSRPERSRPARITIGWMGSPANQVYLGPVRPALSKLLREDSEFALKVVSDLPFSLDAPSVSHKPFREAEEVEDLGSFDIGLACYPEDPWTQAKSPGKLVSYMAAGLPVIGSDVTCVRRIVRHGGNGLLVAKPDGWESALRCLASDWESARRMGAAARRTIEEGYDIRRIASEYVRLFRDLS